MSNFDLIPLRTKLAEYASEGRTMLLPALHAAQDLYGYVPQEAAIEIGTVLKVPLADVYGVIEFYSMLYDRPVGKRVIQICSDPTCAMAGADTLLDAVGAQLELAVDQNSSGGVFSVERGPCLGMCDHAPAVSVDGNVFGEVGLDQIDAICRGEGRKMPVRVYSEKPLLTANCFNGERTNLEQYQHSGGYRAFIKSLEMLPQDVIAEVKASGIVGRGGAAFPTGIKWESAAQAPGEIKYVICNADESEPGTFGNRVLMEYDPHRILEGLLIAAYAVGARKGYIYVRGEYLQSYRALQDAIEEANQAGYFGKAIMGSSFTFEIELRLGAGAYICGEETSLFESIEGKRGFPRIKPPYPTTEGLFGRPTVINNVETLANIPYIIENGAPAYRLFGTPKSPGTKLFCLSGDVARPGLYELPLGASLRHLVFDLAGGLRSKQKLQAVLFGGAAGAFAGPNSLNLRLSFEDLEAAGLPLGAGAIIVIDESRDLRDILLRLGRFFAHESCGKCYPCQLGTQRQLEILERLASGQSLAGDRERLRDVGLTMTDASICGLGQTAAMAALSALKLWPDMFETNGGVHAF